jgi:hypothetical protein
VITAELAKDYLECATDAVPAGPDEDDVINDRITRFAGSMMIADALNRVAHALVLLGNAGAITERGSELGAIEAASMVFEKSVGELTSAVSEVAEAVGNLKKE